MNEITDDIGHAHSMSRAIRRHRELINPDGGPVDIANVGAVIADAYADGIELMVDCGDGMVLPLAELVGYDEQEDSDA